MHVSYTKLLKLTKCSRESQELPRRPAALHEPSFPRGTTQPHAHSPPTNRARLLALGTHRDPHQGPIPNRPPLLPLRPLLSPARHPDDQPPGRQLLISGPQTPPRSQRAHAHRPLRPLPAPEHLRVLA